MNDPPKSKREWLRLLVAGKQRWSEPLSEDDKARGFLGWHERGHLPHCDRPGLIQFVTFRLADSLPAERRGEWAHLLAIEDKREKRRKLEEYLDRGQGACYLRNNRVAAFMEKALLFHHCRRFDLMAWVVMPNHVHVLLRVGPVPLAKIVQNWKSITAVEANRILGRDGRFWQIEYWDQFMRDAEHVHKAIRYIENNPIKAGLCTIPAEWPHSSARLRDPATGSLAFSP
jgi:putative transposase